MKTYKAHYKDAKHDLDIDLNFTENDDYWLNFEIDGVTFKGTFVDFDLPYPEKYDCDKLPFTFFKRGGYIRDDGTKSGYIYSLCRYELDVVIPITVVRISDNKDMDAFIRLRYKVRERTEKDGGYNVVYMCDDKRVIPDIADVYEFSLNIGDEVFYGKNTIDFEIALISICRQIQDIYEMRCCLTCQYSDYSPYGRCEFGSMLCYRRYKEEYLKVNCKDDFFEYLEDLEHEFQPEIYLCNEYAPRIRCKGYRGFISDYFNFPGFIN